MKKFMLLLCMGVFALNVAAQEPVKKSCCKKAKTEKYDFEKIYIGLRKLFELRKNYLSILIKEKERADKKC